MSIRQATKELKDWARKDDFKYFLITKHKGEEDIKYKYGQIEKLFNYTDSSGVRKKFSAPQAQLVYYSPKYAKGEKYKRDKKIKKVDELKVNPSRSNAVGNKGAKNYIKETNVVGKTGEIADQMILELDKEKIKEQESLDGLYTIVSNDLSLLPFQLRSVYRKLKISR